MRCSGTLVLNGVNSYAGRTIVTSGTLQAQADSGLGASPGGYTANQLTLDGGTLVTTASFAIGANRGVDVGTFGATFQPANTTTLTINSPLVYDSSAAGVNMNGLGTLTLNGLNTYSGPTVVNSGRLAFGASGSSPFTTSYFGSADRFWTVRKCQWNYPGI